jgi:hypothetical protein
VVIDETKKVLEFTTVVVAAQNDDRKAFDHLEAIANDASSPFRLQALNAWTTVYESHASPISQAGFTIPWKPGLDPAKLTLQELDRELHNAPPQWRPALLEVITNRNDLPKLDRIELFIEALKTDPSLTGTEYAGRSFNALTGQKFKPLAVKVILEWWAKNRQEFVGK